MCQMCDEYENELVRMGLIEDARAFREERQREHAQAASTASRPPASGVRGLADMPRKAAT